MLYQNRAKNLPLWSPVWLVAHFAFFELDSHEKQTTLEHWRARLRFHWCSTKLLRKSRKSPRLWSTGWRLARLRFHWVSMEFLWTTCLASRTFRTFELDPLEQKRRKFVLPDLHQNKNEEGLLYQANSKAKMNKDCYNTHSWSRNKEELLYQAFSKSKVKKTWFTTPPRNQKWRRIALTSRLQSKSE